MAADHDGHTFSVDPPRSEDAVMPCPHDCQRFGGKVPGYLRGSNWDWVPCWCGGTGFLPVIVALPCTTQEADRG